MKAPKPRKPSQGKHIHVGSLRHLVVAWRARAAQEEWGLGGAFEECSDQLEALLGCPEDSEEDHDGDKDALEQGRCEDDPDSDS